MKIYSRRQLINHFGAYLQKKSYRGQNLVYSYINFPTPKFILNIENFVPEESKDLLLLDTLENNFKLASTRKDKGAIIKIKKQIIALIDKHQKKENGYVGRNF